MKKITFFGSGVELEKYNLNLPEIDSIVKILSKKYDVVLFGGTNIGIMSKFVKSAKKEKLKITSIVPAWFAKKHKNLIYKGDNLLLAKSLAERKQLLVNSDTILVYPGGIGTYDEVFDLIARISLGEINPIPIIIYNFERFYSPILLQIEFGIKVGVIKKEIMDFIYTFEHVDQFEKIINEINK